MQQRRVGHLEQQETFAADDAETVSVADDKTALHLLRLVHPGGQEDDDDAAAEGRRGAGTTFSVVVRFHGTYKIIHNMGHYCSVRGFRLFYLPPMQQRV